MCAQRECPEGLAVCLRGREGGWFVGRLVWVLGGWDGELGCWTLGGELVEGQLVGELGMWKEVGRRV